MRLGAEGGEDDVKQKVPTYVNISMESTKGYSTIRKSIHFCMCVYNYNIDVTLHRIAYNE